jgi:ubiquinone/menaquinone biosynthesis C-methylase UbiE
MPALATTKNWDAHVIHAEQIARGDGFQHLRDRILELTDATEGQHAVDIGAGTGLLTLPLAQRGIHVWAIDIAPAMCDYVRAKAASAQLHGVDVAVASAVSLPLIDACADIVVSNYCFHHLRQDDKHRALLEAHRVLRPGGRLVFGDMMFALSLSDTRSRQVIHDKIRAIARKGPAGILRLAKNAGRLASGRWEQPAPAAWWAHALNNAGFVDVRVEVLEHEGGLASARRP